MVKLQKMARQILRQSDFAIPGNCNNIQLHAKPYQWAVVSHTNCMNGPLLFEFVLEEAGYVMLNSCIPI